MAKISTYTTAIDSAEDKVVGTKVDSLNQTVNYTVGSIAGLATLQTVLDAGDTATGDINLTGSISLSGSLTDSADSIGTPGQLLSSTGTATEWVDPPSGSASTLQEVLDNGNISTTPFDITTGTSYSTIDNLRIKPLGVFSVQGQFTDSLDAVPDETKLLSADASGKPIWVPRSVEVPASATSPGVKGQYAADALFFYICIATGTWRRVSTSTW